MNGNDDIRLIRRLLMGLVILHGVLNVLVALGLYLQFVAKPSQNLRNAAVGPDRRHCCRRADGRLWFHQAPGGRAAPRSDKHAG